MQTQREVQDFFTSTNQAKENRLELRQISIAESLADELDNGAIFQESNFGQESNADAGEYQLTTKSLEKNKNEERKLKTPSPNTILKKEEAALRIAKDNDLQRNS